MNHRAAFGLVRATDLAAVRLDDRARDRKAKPRPPDLVVTNGSNTLSSSFAGIPSSESITVTSASLL
jgi:hypothetical protein